MEGVWQLANGKYKSIDFNSEDHDMKDFGIKSIFTASVLAMGVNTALADTKPLPTLQEGDRAVLTGTVVGTKGDDFTLDFGGNTIEVDLEGWGWGADVSQYLRRRRTTRRQRRRR